MDFPVVRFEVVIDEIVLGRIDDTLEHGARFRGQFLAARRRIEVDVDDARVRQHGFLAEEQAAAGAAGAVTAKVRSLAKPVPARIEGDDLMFDTPEYGVAPGQAALHRDRKSTRLNSSH